MMRGWFYAMVVALSLCVMGMFASEAQARPWGRGGWGRGYYGGWGYYRGYRGWGYGYPAYYGGYYRPWRYGYGYYGYPAYYGRGVSIVAPGFALSIGRPYPGYYGYPAYYWGW